MLKALLKTKEPEGAAEAAFWGFLDEGVVALALVKTHNHRPHQTHLPHHFNELTNG